MPGLSGRGPGRGADEEPQRRREFDRLHRAVAALPPDQRECLVPREFEELSYKEVAASAALMAAQGGLGKGREPDGSRP